MRSGTGRARARCVGGGTRRTRGHDDPDRGACLDDFAGGRAWCGPPSRRDAAVGPQDGVAGHQTRGGQLVTRGRFVEARHVGHGHERHGRRQGSASDWRRSGWAMAWRRRRARAGEGDGDGIGDAVGLGDGDGAGDGVDRAGRRRWGRRRRRVGLGDGSTAAAAKVIGDGGGRRARRRQRRLGSATVTVPASASSWAMATGAARTGDGDAGDHRVSRRRDRPTRRSRQRCRAPRGRPLPGPCATTMPAGRHSSCDEQPLTGVETRFEQDRERVRLRQARQRPARSRRVAWVGAGVGVGRAVGEGAAAPSDTTHATAWSGGTRLPAVGLGGDHATCGHGRAPCVRCGRPGSGLRPAAGDRIALGQQRDVRDHDESAAAAQRGPERAPAGTERPGLR